MANSNPKSLRIDWFDGTVTEEPLPVSTQQQNTQFDPENTTDDAESQPKQYERKLMGFKRLFDLSQMDASTLTLQLSGRSSFWDLLKTELKNDYIVLIVKIVSKLYASLQTPHKSLVLTNLLNNNFITSNFIERLNEYLLNLPPTRIIEKKMNMMFWNEVETFYWDVLRISEGVYLSNINNSAEIAYLLLDSAETSILGLIEEHKEAFTDAIFDKISDIRSNITKIYQKNEEGKVKESELKAVPDKMAHLESYHNMSVFPTRHDLLGEGPYNIEANIINSAYASVDHYLDMQFKLLREDYIGPLREGISKYIENPVKKRHENIRVHPKVRIIRMYVSDNKVGHLVDIAWKERQNQALIDSKKHSYNKHLMYGSLLLFTSDNFDTILCATVLDSSSKLLADGYIAVLFHTPISSNIFSESYTMVESEVFFEPYHRVLKVLQEFNGNDIPMSRYIVDLQQETYAPNYLTPETHYNIFDPSTNSEISFPVLQPDQWGTNNVFGLDESQMDAYKLALTREFAVIQGPPGTGKTFIGLKVATTILNNLSLEGTPMLIICYTNHALDQFLEGLLKVTNSITRLGSQSKNPTIEPFTLNNLRAKCKSKYAYIYTNKRLEQEGIFKDMMSVQDDVEKCEKEILDYNTIKTHLRIRKKDYELNKSKDENPVLKWLFGVDEEMATNDRVLDDWEQNLDNFSEQTSLNDDCNVQSCFSEKWVLKEIDSMKSSIKYVKDITDNKSEREKMVEKFQNQIETLNKRLSVFKKNLRTLHNDNNLSKEFNEVADLYRLNSNDKWILYFKAANSVKERLLKDMKLLQEKYSNCSQELEEVATLVDGEVVKRARVVGATTAAAARRHLLLSNLNSPIVIIEEAAEVLEAHIVASLTHHCKHVILIGDHKQLRPTASHYKLAKDYNFEVSLFERMISNGIHSRTLSTQRRMRPMFVDLIVPTIYDRLDSHPEVVGYPRVTGMEKDLFFLSHNIWEDEAMEYSWSHRHSTEASWCVALADYLQQRQYTPQEVTILTTYTGQASLIKELSKKYVSLRDCTITVVDNYQGEESRIVILSLVRSNKEGKIGFLAAQNRICVALSRAKEGLYMFGNMDMLKSASPIWSSINDKLLAHNAIGDHLTVTCESHPQNKMNINEVSEFDSCLRGQCFSICKNKTMK